MQSWSADAAAQEEGSVSSQGYGDEIGPDGAPQPREQFANRPCFDAPDAQSSAEEQRKAFAAVPLNYQNWLTEDVRYIISPTEHCAFLHLENDEERDQFIEQFWSRRSADLESPGNDFQTEHYRRIVFANQQYSADGPGWESDRGRVYITFGPPDKIDRHAANEPSWMPPENEPGNVIYSWERWSYRCLEDIGENVAMEFVDPQGSNEFSLRMTQDLRSLLPAYSFAENFAAAEPVAMFDFQLGAPAAAILEYKNLEAIVTAHLVRDEVYFTHLVEFTKATHFANLATISVDIPINQLTAPAKESQTAADLKILARVSLPNGHVVLDFERSGKAPEPENISSNELSEKILAVLPAGSYQLDVVVEDIASGKVGASHSVFVVPSYESMAR